MRTRIPFHLIAAVAIGAGPATVSAADAFTVWRLVDLDGQPVAARVTLDLSVPGQLSGRAPCNRYAGRYDGGLPDFRPGPLRATKMACDDLALEGAFLGALSAVTLAEVVGERLVLTGGGGQIVFARATE
jgi:heat shock protein HslJ